METLVRLIRPNTFLIILALLFSSKVWANSTDELQKITKEITEIQKSISKDSPDRSERKLSGTASNLVEHLKAFKEKEVTKDSLAGILNKALHDCKKYKTGAVSKKLESEIKELQLLLPHIAAKQEQNSSRRKKIDKQDFEKRETEGNAEPKVTFTDDESSDKAEQPPVVPAEKKPDNEAVSEKNALLSAEAPQPGGMSAGLVYVLFGVMSMLTVAFGYLLYNTQLRQVHTLAEQIQCLEDELKAYREKSISTPPGHDASVVMSVSEIRKQVQNLERNTVDFLQITDERLTSIEKRAENLAGLSPIEAAVLHTDHKKMTALEEKIRLMERKIHSDSPQATGENTSNAVRINIPYRVEAVDRLIDSIQNLAGHTDIHLLRTVCSDVNILLKLSVAKRSWDDLDPYAIATLFQLAYVSSINEQQDDTYHQLIEAGQVLGFRVHEKITGKAALTIELAENIPYENYLSNPKVKNEEYPNFKAVSSQIERKFILNQTPTGTVLSTLQPAVTLISDGNREVVLQKGKYVIKS